MRQLLQALSFRVPQAVFFIKCTHLIGTLGLIAHWLGCFWYYIGYHEGGWLQGAGLVNEDLEPTEHDNDSFEWVTSLYWAISTMTTIGYGDISAGTEIERAVASVVMVLGCCFFAWSTGTITTLLTNRTHCTERFKDRLDDLEEFFVARSMPSDLVQKVKSFYMLKYPTMRIYDEEQVKILKNQLAI